MCPSLERPTPSNSRALSQRSCRHPSRESAPQRAAASSFSRSSAHSHVAARPPCCEALRLRRPLSLSDSESVATRKTAFKPQSCWLASPLFFSSRCRGKVGEVTITYSWTRSHVRAPSSSRLGPVTHDGGRQTPERNPRSVLLRSLLVAVRLRPCIFSVPIAPEVQHDPTPEPLLS